MLLAGMNPKGGWGYDTVADIGAGAGWFTIASTGLPLEIIHA